MPAKPPDTDENNRLKKNVNDDDYVPETPSPTPRPRRRHDGHPGTTTVYVSPNVSARLDEYRRRKKGRTNLHVLIEAIEENYDRLEEVIEESKVSTGPKTSVFPVDPKAVRYLGGGGLQSQFAPTPDQAKILDELGQRLGFSTRAWIPPVLNAYLPGRKDTRR